MQQGVGRPIKNTVYFVGTPKGEKIYINENYFEIPVGGIISEIMTLSSQFYGGIEKIERWLLSITAGEQPIETLREIHNQMSKLPASDTLQKILLYQPLGNSERNQRIEAEKYMFTSAERTEFYKSEFLMNKEIMECREKRQKEMMENSDVKWNYFHELILDSPIFYTSVGRLSKEQVQVLTECANAFVKEFILLTSNIYRINTHLSEYLEGTASEKKDARDTFFSAGREVTIALTSSQDNLFKKDAGQKYTRVYTARGIYDLVALEISLLQELDREFRKCKLCGRYFVPYTLKNIYCPYPNTKYGNKPCKKVGANKNYRESRVLDPIKKEFDRQEKAYRKWCGDNKEKWDECIDAEIKVVFERWRKTANQAVEAYERGELSSEETWQLIQKPDRSNRSEKLKKVKIYGGY